eukprot:3438563-Prymnesium_polylepis.1
MKPEDKQRISGELGLPALESEAAVFEAARRPRLLFSNLRFHRVPLDTPNRLLQDVLNPGAIALSPKAGCILASNLAGAIETLASAKDASRRNRGRSLVLCASHVTDVRGLLVPEIARALGQSESEVDSANGGEGAKIALLGRSLACGQIRH